MTEDRHDAQIRNVVAELAASAPPAPPFSRIAEKLAAHPHGIRVESVDLGERTSNGAAPYVREPVRDRRHSKPWRMMAALVALGLATAGGIFAYGSLSADDGSATPEAAVKQFVHSFGASDVAGMLEALPPSERVVLRESLESLNQQGSRLRLTRDLNLNNVSGVHLEVTGLQLTSRGLSEDVAAVNVRGTLRSTANDRELPLGDAARDVLVDSLPDHGYQGVADAVDKAVNENSTNGKSIRLVTIKEDGGWHVSVWYTLAEYLRENSGAPMPNFGHSPIKPLGADSPEAVVKALLVSSGDYTKSVALATPDESRVLYDYVPSLTSGNIMSTYYRCAQQPGGQAHHSRRWRRRPTNRAHRQLRLRVDLPRRSIGDDSSTGGSDVVIRSALRRELPDDELEVPNLPPGATPADLPPSDTMCRAEALAKWSHSPRMEVGDDHPADRRTPRRQMVREPGPFAGR